MTSEFKVPKGDAKWQVLRGASPGLGAKRTTTKRARALKLKGSAIGQLGLVPPALNVTRVCKRVLRFRNTATTVKNIQVRYILGALGVTVTVANTTFVTFNSAFLLKKIVIWPAVGSPTFASVDWANTSTTGQGSEKQVIDSVPTGVTSATGPMVFKVPSNASGKNVNVCSWLNANATIAPLFDIQCTAGSVIDVHILYQQVNEIAGYVGALTAAGALGSIGYMPLDGPGGIYTPLGVPVLT